MALAPPIPKPRVRVQAPSIRMDAEMPAGAPLLPVAPLAPPHHAASVSRRMIAWRPGTTGPNAVVAASGPELVRRSRDLRRNNPHAKRAMDLISTHTVGMGIKPRSLCKNKRVREGLMRLWADWTAVADADGVLDFYGMQALAVDEMVEGGEAFARLRTRRVSDGLPVPLQIQLLPAEMVPLDYSTPNGTNPVMQGIERDALGRRVAYWTLPQHPGEWIGTVVGLDNRPAPVPAEDMCHLYNVARIGQARGLPWLAAAMTTLHQVAQYQDAELLRKQMAAAIVGFVKRGMPGDIDPAEMAAGFGQAATQPGDPLPSVALEPGTMQYLEPGEDVEFNTPADVGASYDPFLASNYRAVAAAAGVLYEELTGDWKNANDRTFRAMFNTFKRACSQWQYNLLAQQFCLPIWNRFVAYAVASGAISVPQSVSKSDLYGVAFQPERHAYINPAQDIAATGEEMALGLISRTAAVAERGDDVEVVDAQRVADAQREQAMGLPPPATKGAAPQQDQPQQPQGTPQ